MKRGIDCTCHCHEPGMSVKHIAACCDGVMPKYCEETNEHIDRGSPCILLKGHEAADMPHQTKNGLWWY